ncbi:MAG TPA: hypothetical protein VGL22_17935 [Terracidiphilus sp.]
MQPTGKIQQERVAGGMVASPIARKSVGTPVPHSTSTSPASPETGGGGLSAPANAIKVSSLQALSNWNNQHDAGTPGSSAGTMSMTNSPAKSGNARKFITSFSNYGGQRYSASIGADVNAKNFLYDGWVFLQNTGSTIGNIEMDLNQVTSSGLTVIFGFQCDKWSGTWDYTANKGTAASPDDTWIHSAAPCDPAKWAQNTWHHVQIRYARDDSGYVTYQSVALDGAVQNINAKVFSAFNLGWSPTILTNFQIDGAFSGSGSSTVYLDSLALYRW